MSDQTPKALKQSLLEQINADKKAVETLSDEELEAVAGGAIVTIPIKHTPIKDIPVYADLNRDRILKRTPLIAKPQQPPEGLGPGIDPNIL